MLNFIKDNTSRMTGDCHVRFCERLRGEIPLCLLGTYNTFQDGVKNIAGMFAIPYVIYNRKPQELKSAFTSFIKKIHYETENPAKFAVTHKYILLQFVGDAFRSTKDFLRITKDTLEPTKDILEQTKDIPGQAKDILEQAKDILEQAKDTLEPTKDILEQAKDTLEPTKDILRITKDILEPAKDILRSMNYIPNAGKPQPNRFLKIYDFRFTIKKKTVNRNS